MAFFIWQDGARTCQTSAEIARVKATSLATRKTYAGLGLESLKEARPAGTSHARARKSHVLLTLQPQSSLYHHNHLLLPHHRHHHQPQHRQHRQDSD